MRSSSPVAKRNLLILILAAAGIGSWWLLDEQRERATSDTERVVQPDSYFNDMELVRFDENGRPSMKLTSRRAVHYPDDPNVHLTDLRADAVGEQGKWSLSARTGTLASEDNHLHVEEAVELKQLDTQGPPMQLFTSVMDLDADSETLQTAAPIEIRYGESTFTGNGLWASLADGHIIIQSDVKARYAQ